MRKLCVCVRKCVCFSSAEGYIKTSFSKEFSLIKGIWINLVQKVFLLLTLLF